MFFSSTAARCVRRLGLGSGAAARFSAERTSVRNPSLKTPLLFMREGVKGDLSPAAERLLCAGVFVFSAAAGL